MENLTHTDEYTPCRINEFYFDNGDIIEVLSSTYVSKFRLQGLGRKIWLMLNGKNTIRTIVNQLCLELSLDNDEEIKKELITVLRMLRDRKSIIINWDPIHKMQLSQELE